MDAQQDTPHLARPLPQHTQPCTAEGSWPGHVITLGSTSCMQISLKIPVYFICRLRIGNHGVHAWGTCTYRYMAIQYLQQITALQDSARSRKDWRTSKDRAYLSVCPSMMRANSFSWPSESPREAQCPSRVSRVACRRGVSVLSHTCYEHRGQVHA